VADAMIEAGLWAECSLYAGDSTAPPALFCRRVHHLSVWREVRAV